MTNTELDTTPRTVDQVQFVPHLPWEQVAAMYRQAVADSGHTMSYAARAQEVLRCVATAAKGLDESALANLEAIGKLLVLWEGSLMLLESRCDELEEVSAARLGLLEHARAKIAELKKQ